MPGEGIFTVTEAHLDTGLRGFPVGTCRTSRVDPYAGVSYLGFPIGELADRVPEEVVHLLLERALPDPDQLRVFSDDLRSRRGLPDDLIVHLRGLPKQGHPMEWLASALIALGMLTRTGNYAEDARNLVARAPELVAAIYRIRSGWGEPIASRSDLGLVENFVHVLGVPGADSERLTRLLSAFYILHMDHGGGNLSTFTGKAVASGRADLFMSMAAAMAGLSGPLHGRANQDCLAFVRKVGSSDPAHVEAFVRKTLAEGGKIYGFGHAVLRAEDPRATFQYALGQELFASDPLFQVALTLRSVVPEVLSEHEKISNPFPNVDAVSGSLLQAAGLTDANFYTVLFGLSRITGIAAQIVDERLRFRGGRGVPIYRPKFIARDQDPR